MEVIIFIEENIGAFYISGMIIAILICTCMALYEHYVVKHPYENMEDFPSVFALIGFLSWIGVFLLIYNIYKRFFKA